MAGPSGPTGRAGAAGWWPRRAWTGAPPSPSSDPLARSLRTPGRALGRRSMQPAGATPASDDFAGFGGTCAVLTGVAGFLYAVAFVVVARSSPAAGALLSALFLLAFGLLASAALVALYEALRPAGPGLALWALLLALVGALGAA